MGRCDGNGRWVGEGHVNPDRMDRIHRMKPIGRSSGQEARLLVHPVHRVNPVRFVRSFSTPCALSVRSFHLGTSVSVSCPQHRRTAHGPTNRTRKQDATSASLATSRTSSEPSPVTPLRYTHQSTASPSRVTRPSGSTRCIPRLLATGRGRPRPRLDPPPETRCRGPGGPRPEAGRPPRVANNLGMHWAPPR